MSRLPDYGITRDYPTLWEKGVQYDISQRLGGTDNKLLAEIDAALRELWDARRHADSQPDCEHDYVYVSRSEDYYRCDKCGQSSKDGVYPRIGNFDPHKPAEEPT